MLSLPRLTPRLRRREIGRRVHFQRTALTACALVGLWLLTTMAVLVQARADGLTSALLLWFVLPFAGLIVFDRVQASLDRACGGTDL